MRQFALLGVAFFFGSFVCVSSSYADNTPPASSTGLSTASGAVSETKQEAKEDSPAEKAYKAKTIAISDAITRKIAEIQAKQRAIDTEVYPAYKPPLIAEKAALEEELRQLEMERDRMQAEKTAQDMAAQLKNLKSKD